MTSFARIAAVEIAIISAHTTTAKPPSTAVAEAGIEKDTADWKKKCDHGEHNVRIMLE